MRRRHILDQLRREYPYHKWDDHVWVIGQDGGMGRWSAGLYRLPFPVIGIDDLEYVLDNLFAGHVEFAAANATYIPLAPNTDPIRAHATVGEPARELTEEPYVISYREIGED